MKKITAALFMATIGLSGCDRSIAHEMDAIYGASIEVLNCEEYGGLAGTWVKCQFRNKQRVAVEMRELEAVCYRGEVNVGSRVIGGRIDPGEIKEEALVCGGSGITLIKFRMR
jgi:hypothetical protein